MAGGLLAPGVIGKTCQPRCSEVQRPRAQRGGGGHERWSPSSGMPRDGGDCLGWVPGARLRGWWRVPRVSVVTISVHRRDAGDFREVIVYRGCRRSWGRCCGGGGGCRARPGRRRRARSVRRAAARGRCGGGAGGEEGFADVAERAAQRGVAVTLGGVSAAGSVRPCSAARSGGCPRWRPGWREWPRRGAHWG